MKGFKVQSLALALVLLTASPGLAAPQPNAFQQIWTRIVGSKPKPRSVRGGVCPVMPSPDALIWRDRPIFVWKGEVNQVKLYREDEPQKVIWSSAVKKGQSSVTYDGKPLAPGTYIWKMVGTGLPIPFYFGVMGGSDREEIDLKLKQAISKGASPQEDLISRLNVWSQENLVSDTMMELYAVSDSVPEIETMRKDFVPLVCKTK